MDILTAARAVAQSNEPDVLGRISDQAIGLSIWRRTLPDAMSRAAAVLCDGPLDFRCVLTLEQKSFSTLRGALRERGAEDLACDIEMLATRFASVSGATFLALRLEVVRDDGCRRFHLDNVPLRLVTTYHGDGTQWAGDASALAEQDRYRGPLDTLRPGDVSLFRGKRCIGATVPHRSPPNRRRDARLVVVLDPGGAVTRW